MQELIMKVWRRDRVWLVLHQYESMEPLLWGLKPLQRLGCVDTMEKIGGVEIKEEEKKVMFMAHWEKKIVDEEKWKL